MSEVVKQGGESYQLDFVIGKTKLLGQQARNVANSETVVEAGMQGAWVDQVCHSELADASQALENRRVNQLHFIGTKNDEVVNRIAYSDSVAHDSATRRALST